MPIMAFGSGHICVLILFLAVTTASGSAALHIIPQPVSAEPTAGQFTLTAITTATCTDVSLLRTACDMLGVKPATWPASAPIQLIQNPSRNDLGNEGYELTVSPSRIDAEASHPAGIFYALQTLRQLRLADNSFPACHIVDQPRFPYRGLMLDSARHMQSKEYIEQFILRMSELKLNRFHWHLTDDQGWRLEIKSRPKLTEIGAWRSQPDQRYGGFYSQDDIRQIVAFADAHFVTIVPEIDMPGHCTAAVASYPDLGCTGKSIPVRPTFWGTDAVLCVGNEQTYHFCEQVLTEVMDLFPHSPMIHIGGDECSPQQWHHCPVCQQRMRDEHLKDEVALQGYFTTRLAGFLHSHGRRMQGWNEIRKSTVLPPGTIVQQWNDPRCATESTQAGFDVVCSPGDFCYFDHTYFALPTRHVFDFEPMPSDLKPELSPHILGPEATLWTETLTTGADVNRMTYPRVLALAQIAWSPKEDRTWDDFIAAAQSWIARQQPAEQPGLKERLIGNINYGTQIAAWSAATISTRLQTHTWDITPFLSGPGTYQITFEHHSGPRWLFIEDVCIDPGGTHDHHPGYAAIVQADNIYQVDLKSFDPKTPYHLSAQIRSADGTESAGVIYLNKQFTPATSSGSPR